MTKTTTTSRWMISLTLLSLLLAPVACSRDTDKAASKAADIQFRNMKKIGNLHLGGQPSPDELRRAVEAGANTVINLRGVDEPGVADEQALAAELGVAYVSIPISGVDDLTLDAARKLDDALSSAAGKPVIVHCSSGNRVGGLFAVRARELQQKTADEALKIGLSHGMTRFEPAIRKRFGLAE